MTLSRNQFVSSGSNKCLDNSLGGSLGNLVAWCDWYVCSAVPGGLPLLGGWLLGLGAEVRGRKAAFRRAAEERAAKYLALWFKPLGHENSFVWHVIRCSLINLRVYWAMPATAPMNYECCESAPHAAFGLNGHSYI